MVLNEKEVDVENGDTPVEFDIFGRKLTVSSGRKEYNRLRFRFRTLAREQADEAKISIERFADNPKWLLCDGFRWAKPYFAKAADLAVEELLQKGVFDLDGEVYLKEHLDLAPWERGFKAASNAYKCVVNAEKQREKERAEQTDELGSSWSGGGFGLTGAIKGAVEAEALNLASAAISGTFNAIGRKMSKKENEKKFQDIFKRRKDEIINGVFETIANGADALVACCNEHGIRIEGAVTVEEAVKAERMCNNLKVGKIPTNMVADVKLSILDANPYCKEFYDYVYMTDGDPSGELEKVGAFFGVSFDDRKKDAFAARLGECPCGDEDEVKAYREMAIALAAELKYDASETFGLIDAKLDEFDRLAKTVDGRLLESRELAAKHREISAMIAAADLSTEERALKAKSAIEEMAEKLAVDCKWQMERIESALKQFDEAARTVDGRIFATREETHKQKKLSDFEQGLDISTEETANASLVALDAKIRELAVDGEWKRERVRSAIKRFDQMACMAFGRQYKTRDEAKSAKGEASRFLEGVELVVRQSGNRFFAGDNIPTMFVKGARANLGVVPGERIVGLVSVLSLSSLFKSMNTGLVLTMFGIRWKNSSVATTRNFISWQDYAIMNPPVANGKLIDFGNGAIFETGSFLGMPVRAVLTMLQRVHEFCKEATCFGR